MSLFLIKKIKIKSIMKTYILALMLVLTAVLSIALFYGFRHLSVLRNQVNQNTNLIVGLQSMLSSRIDTLVNPSTNFYYNTETAPEQVETGVQEGVDYEELSEIEEESDEDSDSDSDDEEETKEVEEAEEVTLLEPTTNDFATEETNEQDEIEEQEMVDMVQKLVSKTEEVVKSRKRHRPAQSVTNFNVGDNIVEDGVNYMITLTPSGRKKWTMSV